MLSFLQSLLFFEHQLQNLCSLDIQLSFIVLFRALNEFVKQLQCVLVTLLFGENLHELDGGLNKLITLSLNLLEYSVSIFCVCQYVQVLSIKDLAPNVVQTYRFVVVFSGEVEL